MGVLHVLISLHLLISVIKLYPGDVAGQLTPAPPTCTGDTFIFRCNVTGNISGFTIWRVGGSSTCGLIHRSTSSSRCGTNDAFTARSGTGFGPATSATSFTSTLSGTATPTLNGTLVECFGPALNADPGNRVDISTLWIRSPPSVSVFCRVDLSQKISGAVNVTVNWTLSGGDSADFYFIDITSTTPLTPYGGLLNITTPSVTQYELTGFMAGYEYNITVCGVNCGNQKGSESKPLTITPQVSATPASTICAVYDMGTEALQIIENTWNVVDNVTVSKDCTNGQDIRASYELSYTTDSGTLNTSCVVDGAECSNGTCQHELQSNTADRRCQPPVSQLSGKDVTVSVTARNIVGRSNPAVSRTISGRNHDLGVHIATNLSNAFVECTFYQPGYTCTIDYGADPSYTNMVYKDTSSTQGRTTTITLSQRLNEDTTYYYIVSAESSSQCMRVRGRFRADQIFGDIVGSVVGSVVGVVVLIIIIIISIVTVVYKISQNTDDYFFIQSTVGVAMVMDVEHSNPDPGTPVISYCRNDPELVYNQLWMKEHIGKGEFYLVSKLGPDCKLTIQNETAVIDTTGTLFKEMRSGGESVMLILSGTDQALQVNDGYSCTPIMAVPKDEDSSKQKWILKNHNAK